jgi:hypothetical protein
MSVTTSGASSCWCSRPATMNSVLASPGANSSWGGEAASTRRCSCRSGMAVGLQLDRSGADDSVSLALGVAVDVLEPFSSA